MLSFSFWYCVLRFTMIAPLKFSNFSWILLSSLWLLCCVETTPVLILLYVVAPMIISGSTKCVVKIQIARLIVLLYPDRHCDCIVKSGSLLWLYCCCIRHTTVIVLLNPDRRVIVLLYPDSHFDSVVKSGSLLWLYYCTLWLFCFINKLYWCIQMHPVTVLLHPDITFTRKTGLIFCILDILHS